MKNLLKAIKNISKATKKNPSKALKTYLCERAKNGSPSAILFAQIALFTATIFAWETRLYTKHDSTGFKMALSYQIIAVLVSYSRHLSHLGFIHRTCGYKVNSIATLICLVLAIVLDKFYEKSLSSLGFALSITVLLLILLVIIRPSTDLGLFGFLIGVIGSVAYNLFELKFQTWIVVAICFPLLGFRCWLDKNWLEVGADQLLFTVMSARTRTRNQISKLEIIEVVIVAGFHIFWVFNLFMTSCRKIKGQSKSISCTSSSVMEMLICVVIFIVNSLFQRKLKELLLKWERRKLRERLRERLRELLEGREEKQMEWEELEGQKELEWWEEREERQRERREWEERQRERREWGEWQRERQREWQMEREERQRERQREREREREEKQRAQLEWLQREREEQQMAKLQREFQREREERQRAELQWEWQRKWEREEGREGRVERQREEVEWLEWEELERLLEWEKLERATGGVAGVGRAGAAEGA